MFRSYLSTMFNACILIALSVLSLASNAGSVSDYGQLHVQGNKIISEITGKPVQLKGYSTHGLQWFPYVTGSGGTIENMVNDFDVQVVRLEVQVLFMLLKQYCEIT